MCLKPVAVLWSTQKPSILPIEMVCSETQQSQIYYLSSNILIKSNLKLDFRTKIKIESYKAGISEEGFLQSHPLRHFYLKIA